MSESSVYHGFREFLCTNYNLIELGGAEERRTRFRCMHGLGPINPEPEAAEADSFAKGRLEYPYYTRPEKFRSWRVPEVLLSGDHRAIARWTLPLWIYVSVTGVMVYWMLYQMHL